MRIKITGYVDTRDLPSNQVDIGHETGLSIEGYDEIAGIESDWRVADLEDIDVELVRD